MIKLKGKVSGRDFVRDIPIELPDNESRHDVLATLWARTRIDDLMGQDYAGIQNGNARDDIREAITQLGLSFRLMTQFTSFVAVEEMTVTDGGEPRKIEVPVEMPEGVSHTDVFGEGDKPFEKLQLLANLQRAPLASKAPSIARDAGGGRARSGAPSKGESPKMSVQPVPPPASPQSKAKAGKDLSAGRADGIGSGNSGGIGPGNSAGAAPSPTFTPNSGLTLAQSLGMATKSDRITPEVQKRRELLSKVNPSISAVIERLKNKSANPSDDEAKFVRNGKAEIQVWLVDKSPETIAQLKQLGFEVVLEPKSATMIIGRLPIEKLAALAELKAVRYVVPMTTK